jgi:hypothetical protein
MTTRLLPTLLLGCAIAATPPLARAQQGAPFQIGEGERIVFIGNTFAERMQIFPHFEKLLTSLQPERHLTFRYLAWSGDEVALQPRPLNFGDIHEHLEEQQADVIFAAFGMNESYRGAAALPELRMHLEEFLRTLLARQYNGSTPPRVVLLSPIAHEEVDHVPLDPGPHNRDLALYTEAMREVAESAGVRFVDLFTPTVPLTADPALGDLTINGIHLNDPGYRIVSDVMARSLGWIGDRPLPTDIRGQSHDRLAEAIKHKNELFFYRWRAVNGEYIYGRRKEPFGVVNFPGEMEALEKMIAAEEAEIWRLASSGPSR